MISLLKDVLKCLVFLKIKDTLMNENNVQNQKKFKKEDDFKLMIASKLKTRKVSRKLR